MATAKMPPVVEVEEAVELANNIGIPDIFGGND